MEFEYAKESGRRALYIQGKTEGATTYIHYVK